MSAGHVKLLGYVKEYEKYEINFCGVTGQLWVLPHLAEKAWVEAMNELETFSRRPN